MSKVNLKDYKKENRGLLRKSVEERVTYKKSGPKPKPEDEKNSAKILVSMKPANVKVLRKQQMVAHFLNTSSISYANVVSSERTGFIAPSWDGSTVPKG